MRRRLLIISEFEAFGVLDQGRMDEFADGRSDTKVENALAKDIESGERNVRGVLEQLCEVDGIEPYAGAICSVKVQYECEKHPNHWADKPGDKCDQCKLGNLNGYGRA